MTCVCVCVCILQGWEETLDNSLLYLLKTTLTKEPKDMPGEEEEGVACTCGVVCVFGATLQCADAVLFQKKNLC